jgi:CheY-like chemotaxis protein
VTDPHILIIEDSPSAALVIGQALLQNKKNYQISYAYNGRQALKQSDKTKDSFFTVHMSISKHASCSFHLASVYNCLHRSCIPVTIASRTSFCARRAWKWPIMVG